MAGRLYGVKIEQGPRSLSGSFGVVGRRVGATYYFTSHKTATRHNIFLSECRSGRSVFPDGRTRSVCAIPDGRTGLVVPNGNVRVCMMLRVEEWSCYRPKAALGIDSSVKWLVKFYSPNPLSPDDLPPPRGPRPIPDEDLLSPTISQLPARRS